MSMESKFPRWFIWVIIGVIAVSALGISAILFWPDKSDEKTEESSQGDSSKTDKDKTDDKDKDKFKDDRELEPVTEVDTEDSEPVELSSELQNNCAGFLSGYEGEFETIGMTTAGWVRPHPGPFAWEWIEPEEGEYDFSMTDYYMEVAAENNIAILPTLWPYASWDQLSCHEEADCKVTQVDQFYPDSPDDKSGGIPVIRCVPCDMEKYSGFVKTLVERYDGDGKNDMPGLEIPIKYWEISNEPSMQEGDLTFFLGTEEEYLEILKTSYQAINEVCPDCKVLHAGAAGVADDDADFWGKVFELGGGDYFDIANIHCIGCGDEDLYVEEFGDLLDEYGLDKPIWVTEAEFKDADEIIPTFTTTLEAGADRVFFCGLGGVGHSGPPEEGVYAPEYENLVQWCESSE